ncbi:MAG: single-stranded DNA-binding protein [Microbacterium sp.]|nr:single-stranded DNA-binding protein [Microbacterium sp.]
MSEKITVVGNIGSVPERRALPRGGAVTSFRIAATGRRYDESTSAWVDDHTSWFTVSAFRALGEHAHRSLHKGDRVIVTGRFRVREWEAGDKRGTSAEIDADALGHDLLWGTSEFRREQNGRTGTENGSSVSGEAQASADGSASATGTADAWSAPGAPRELVTSGEAPF